MKSRILKRLDEDADVDRHPTIVDDLVEALEVHAREYLQQVADERSAKNYIKDLRRVGAALIENAEQLSVLADPYRDAKLRRIAESSIEFIRQRATLSLAQQNQFITEAVACIREQMRPKADQWQAWRAEMVFKIDARFEAVYLHWEAEALDRLRALRTSATCTDAGEKPVIQPLRSDGAEGAGQRATSWQGIQISFLSDNRLQIRNGARLETYGYGEFGFADQRSGKPKRAWIVLRALAEHEGILSGAKATSVAWTLIERRVQEIRKVLRTEFGLPGDPLPFVPGTGYQAVFKISCAASYES